MFKLLPIVFACFLCSVAYTRAEGSLTISSISSKSVQSAPTSTAIPPQLQSNAVSEDEDDSDEATAGDEPGTLNAPASVTRLAASSASSAAPSALFASASARSPSLQVSASVKSSPPSVAIQHHVLAAEPIPLPITISTRPGIRTVIAPETITINEPAVAKVGEVVQQIPTAVSHQSQTVVHQHARIVTPIVAPAVRTITSQVLRAYHTPIVPVVRVASN